MKDIVANLEDSERENVERTFRLLLDNTLQRIETTFKESGLGKDLYSAHETYFNLSKMAQNVLTGFEMSQYNLRHRELQNAQYVDTKKAA